MSSSASFSDEYDATQTKEEELWSITQDMLDSPTFSVESGVEGESQAPTSPEESLEYGHIDGITYDGDLAHGIALRMHPYKQDRKTLGVRTRARSGSFDTEYQDLLKAFASGALTPRYYVVGHYFQDSMLSDSVGSSFRHVHVIDTRVMLYAIVAGDIDPVGPFPSDKGNSLDASEAMYISLDELEEIGAILYERHEAEW